MISSSDTVENIMEKGESANYQNFVFFSQCFQKTNLLGLLKLLNVWCSSSPTTLSKLVFLRVIEEVDYLKKVNPLPDNKIFALSK